MNHLAAGGLLLLAILPLASCTDESNQDVKLDSKLADASTPVDTRVCSAIQSAQPIPALDSAYLGATPAMERTAYVDDLFNLFASHCGGCHVDVGLGGFQTSRATFSQVVNQDWVDSIGYNRVNTVMPPPSVGGQLAKDRPADDPVNELQTLLQAWIDAGSPRDVFQVAVDPSTAAGPYGLSPDLAAALTNIGNCLPEKALYATEQTIMAELDIKFATLVPSAPGKGTRTQQIGLPEKLSDTDLTTFDSRELAKYGVISYSITYPQWVGPDSRIIRHVRVPLGQSITFDKTTQQFAIPGDTRFYRTILQRVVDANGSERWRKIETQLIVAWPNATGKAGYKAVTSTSGTYAWNDNESQATLVTDPYRNGTPFRDRIVTYVTDEPKAAEILSKNPSNQSYALRSGHALRSYAIPGTWRCGQCHVGSPSKDFILGFQPIQIARRKKGEGGNVDDVGDDELTQLSRFIDIGLITGLSPTDVLPLENSEGARAPRNDAELTAQAYLLGNCANCHNPVGYATLENPNLSALLDFQPSETGGVFQFPLEQYSPRITRGAGVPVPYITPSLLDIDHPSSDPVSGDAFWKPKCNPNSLLCIYAPWRSLIYRGVDTPFTYSDDVALFPHMPMNTQSFDIRAPRILGDWMVSIPAVLKDTNVVEYAIRTNNVSSPTYDGSPQPYKEIKPGHTGYKAAVAAAAARLDKYHNVPSVPVTNWILPTNENPNPVQPPMPSRYQFSPDTFDILDPLVVLDPQDYPVPIDDPTGIRQNGKQVMPPDNVPDHAHWVVLDQTQVPGDWSPRRPDWYQVLVSGDATVTSDEKRVVDLLQSATLSNTLKQFALTEVPLGLWQTQSSCDFSGVSKVSDYSKAPPTWMRQALAQKQLTGNEPVYLQAPGEFIHNLICANCHGAKADSNGRQATILREMTGGHANVTDLIDGIIVPANRQPIFQKAPLDHASVDDWAARYFAWMGLGGTQQSIPASILAVVSSTNVVGTPRPRALPPVDANMLSNAYNLCADVLPAGLTNGIIAASPETGNYSFENGMFRKSTALIYSNGDAMLWGQLCSVDNPPPIRAFAAQNWANPSGFNGAFNLYTTGFYDSTLFPPGNSIVNQLGQVIPITTSAGGIPTSIYYPWCMRKPSDPGTLKLADAWRTANLAPTSGHVATECMSTPSVCTQLPYCPETDKNGAPYIGAVPNAAVQAQLTQEQLLQWATRGAINAGLVAFAYLMQLQDGDVGPSPAYDQCSQLSN